ncbi:hypothetical protein MHIB_11550 [Mycolicibacter hiberniae]|uniref:Uncharacterized protein n=1 Tax=Mycolicibacter hiberniae TaxID=29314 RepID=A0A7I7X1N1_9MYCO|nr:hypothetical protein MHIB_11550 [Mycolicibacter hiberniae]
MGDQCPGGVEHHGVAHRAFGSAEHRARLLSVGLRVTAEQFVHLGAGKPERGRVEGQPIDGAGLHPPDRARGGGGQFVEAVIAVHHQHAGVARREHPGHHLGQIAEGAPDQPGPRARRVGQRPQQVEHRRHTDLAASHRRVAI